MHKDPEERTLREQLEQRERELDAVQRVTRAVAAETDETALTRSALRTALDVMDADAGAVLLFDPGSGELKFRYVEGGAGERLEDTALAVTEGIAGEVYRTGHPRISPNASADPEHTERVERDFDYAVGDMMTVPLAGHSSDQRLGVMQVLNKHVGSFDQNDLRLLAILGSEVTVAIEQARLHRAAREPERLALVGRMSAGIIHDLRGPLTSIKGFAELLTSTEDPNERQEFSDIVSEGVERISLMMQEVLDFARGKVASLSVESVTLGEFLTDVEPKLRRDVEPHGVEVSFAVAEAEGVKVSIDASRMARVLLNLSSNARDAMRGEGGSLDVQTERSDCTVAIVVRDTGPGIPDEIAESLFDPFVTHGKERGTGLGLAICRQIVEAHGGSIKLDRKAGEGAAFIIELPMVIA
jgi:signal transduction histidine kinase